MKKNLHFVLALTLGLATTVSAQDWSVDSRTRVNSTEDATSTDQRVRAAVDFGGDAVSAHVEFNAWTTLGNGAYYFIAVSAFSVMFSTCITVYDGYSRAMSETTALLLEVTSKKIKTYKIWLSIVLLGAFIVIHHFIGSFKELVDLATIISFVIAPLIAVVNYKLVLSDDLTPKEKPNLLMRILSVMGIIYLLVFSILFLAIKFDFIQL